MLSCTFSGALPSRRKITEAALSQIVQGFTHNTAAVIICGSNHLYFSEIDYQAQFTINVNKTDNPELRHYSFQRKTFKST